MSELTKTMPPIEIKNPQSRISLKQFAVSDAEEIFRLINKNRKHLSQFGDETASKYLTLKDMEDSIRAPKNKKRLRFAMRNSEGILMGSINLTPDEDNSQQGEIGYYIGEEFQGQGFTTEAVRLLSGFAFDKLGYKKLYAKVHSQRIGSQKVLLKANYQETEVEEDGHKIFTLGKRV